MSVRQTISSLAKVNVEIVDDIGFWLRCKQCNRIWSPAFPPNGQRMARGWWKCPHYGCNDPNSPWYCLSEEEEE